MSDAAFRRRPALPDRDSVGGRAARARGRARRGRAALGSRPAGLAGKRRDDADRRGDPARWRRWARTQASRSRSSSGRAAPGTRAASRSLRPPSVASRAATPGVDASIAEVRRGVALGIRSFLVADLGVLKALGDMRRGGDLPPSLVLKTSVLLPCANSETAALLEQLGATTINVSTDLSPHRARRAAGRVLGTARRLRRGPGRPGWLRAVLRRAGDRPARRARLREARASERAEHLPVRPPPRGSRGASSGASACAGRSSCSGSSKSKRRSSSRDVATTGPPTSGSRSRERAVRGDLHGRAGGHPGRARPAHADASAVDQAARAGYAARRPGVHGPRSPGDDRGPRSGDPEGPHDARRGAGRAGGGVRVQPGHRRASRRALGHVARVARRRRLRPRRRLPGHRLHPRGGLPRLLPLRHSGGLDLALGARGDTGAGDDRRRQRGARRLGRRRRRRRRGRTAARSRRTCSAEAERKACGSSDAALVSRTSARHCKDHESVTPVEADEDSRPGSSRCSRCR